MWIGFFGTNWNCFDNKERRPECPDSASCSWILICPSAWPSHLHDKTGTWVKILKNKHQSNIKVILPTYSPPGIIRSMVCCFDPCGAAGLLTELLQSTQIAVPLGKLTSSGLASTLLPGLFLTQQHSHHHGSKSLLIHSISVFEERATFWDCNARVECRVQTGKTEATQREEWGMTSLIFNWSDFWVLLVCFVFMDDQGGRSALESVKLKQKHKKLLTSGSP